METRTGTPLTGLQATFAINRTKNANYSATQGAKYTQSVLNSHGTQTNRPTSTPSPTFTPRPTATPIPLPPQLGYDLIWLRGDWGYYSEGWGKIMRFNSRRGIVEVLVGNDENSLIKADGEVMDFQLYDEVNKMLVLIKGKRGVYEIAVVDLDELSITILVSIDSILPDQDNPFGALSISPDGEWLVYGVVDGFIEKNEKGQEEREYIIFLQNLLSTANPIQVGTCKASGGGSHFCEWPSKWSSDSQIFAFRGEVGVWVSDLQGSLSLVVHDIFWGEEEYKQAHFFPQAWSPQGRFLLVIDAGWEGGYLGIVDIYSFRYENLDNTEYCAGCGYSEAIWLDDGRIIVMHTYREEPAPELPKFYVYRLNTKGEPMIVEQFSSELEENFGVYSYGMYQYLDSSIRFAAIHEVDSSTRTSRQFMVRLVQLNIHNQTFQSLGEGYEIEIIGRYCHYLCGEFVWVLDGSWVLLWDDDISQKDVYTYLFKTSGYSFFDLSNIIGPETCCFQWIEHNHSHP